MPIHLEMVDEQAIQRRIPGIARAVGGLLRADRHQGAAIHAIEGVPRSVATRDGGVNSGHGRPHKASGGPARSGRREMGRSMESCGAISQRSIQVDGSAKCALFHQHVNGFSHR